MRAQQNIDMLADVEIARSTAVLGILACFYVSLPVAQSGSTAVDGNSVVKQYAEELGLKNVEMFNEIPMLIRGPLNATVIQFFNHPPQELPQSINVGEIFERRVTLDLSDFGQDLNLITGCSGENQKTGCFTILLLLSNAEGYPVLMKYFAPSQENPARAEVTFLKGGGPAQLHFTLKAPIEKSALIVSRDEWLDLLKRSGKPGVMQPHVLRSEASRMIMEMLQSEGKLMSRGSLTDWEKVSDQLPTKLKIMIKSNLLEWYASELAKPYTDNFQRNSWTSMREDNVKQRETKLSSYRPQLAASWKNLQAAANILGLPQIPEPD